MKITRISPTVSQSIECFGTVVKPVDRLTKMDLMDQLRQMDAVARENIFGEEEPWTVLISQ